MTHAHLADTKRDAVALWRAVLASDMEGAGVIAANTPCQGCLAIQAVVLGLVVTADEPYLNDEGLITLPPDEREQLDAFLMGWQDVENGAV
jgi:hypothetical protein